MGIFAGEPFFGVKEWFPRTPSKKTIGIIYGAI